MKKIFYFLIALMVFINLSCLNDKDNKNQSNNEKNIEIFGKLEIGKDNLICIVANWNSRSRISYYVYGEYQKKLSKNIGKIVRVSGKIIGELSPWSKKILVNSIIKLESK